MQAFANTVLQAGVGALVQLGVQALKTALIEKSAAAMAAAGYVAEVTGQVAANTALAAQAAFASTAAIPIVGPALAPAAAAAAGSAAAALGAPAVSAAAGTLAGRQYGGNVYGDKAYRVNEGGKPEIFNAANGRQYMLPNQRGEVVSNADAQGGAGVVNYVSITVDGSGSASTDGTGANSDARGLASAIQVVVMDVLERESRQGGMIWRQRNQQNG